MDQHYIAFFDVDQTLTNVTSMISFLDYYDPERLAAFRASKRQWHAPTREVINTRYYEIYAGLPHADVMAAGRAWYTKTRQALGDAFFIASAVAELQAHRAQGATIALVSGSFPPCLVPLAAELGGCDLLCSQLEVDARGLYTGRLLPPQAIGEGKAVAARTLAERLQVRLADCHAYGDHISDVPLLRLVGNGHVVGNDPELSSHVAAHGWQRHQA